MVRRFVAKTKNGFSVYVDMENSHASTHLTDTPQLLELVKEVLEEYEPQSGIDEYICVEKDMGRIVGKTDLVAVDEGDEILYAKRPNRDNYTKFALNKKPEPSEDITIWLRKDSDNEYELTSCHIGKLVPFFPGDPYEQPESKAFWKTHALAWGTQEIVSGTETKECPW